MSQFVSLCDAKTHLSALVERTAAGEAPVSWSGCRGDRSEWVSRLADRSGGRRGRGSVGWDHSDPIDRLLVAQAVGQGMIFVTADRIVRGFGGVAQLWAG